MRLLILTQKIDINDDLLGVYHSWIEKLAQKVEKVNVICLFKGQFHLPPNVSVYSLGKEQGNSQLKYVKNFFYYIWKLRRDYDVVFVHMNKEYVLLAGLIWRLWGKKIVLWYAHYLIKWQVRAAAWLSHQVVTSASFACQIKSRKLSVVGQGIDVNYFRNLNYRNKDNKINLLFLGRISSVKDLGTLINAISLVLKKNSNIYLNVVGSPGEKDEPYWQSIKNLVTQLSLDSFIRFWGKVSWHQTLEFYNQNDIFINLTRTGSFDKTTLEAMACEKLVLVCNRAFENIFPEDLKSQLIFLEKDSQDLADKISGLLVRQQEEKEAIGRTLREIIVQNHSLERLVDKLIEVFKNNTQ